MIDKMQKIKEWISKTQDGLMDANGNFENLSDEGAFHILTNLDYYIDSLQEEPVSEDFEKIVEEIAEPTILNAYGAKELARRLRNTICGISVSEDLEKASKEWLAPQLDKSYAGYGETKMMELTHFDGYAMLDAIEFGAKWQKERDNIPVSEDLNEAAIAYNKKVNFVCVGEIPNEHFIAGAQWQKEQLQKEQQ